MVVPAIRLRPVAAGAVALAATACQDQAFHMKRAFGSVRGEGFGYLSFWERFFVDPPSRTSPLLALAAVLLILLLPAAARLERRRRVVCAFVALVSLTSAVNALAHLWINWRRPHLGLGRLNHNVIADLPWLAVSIVLLVLVIDIWRWGVARPHDVDAPDDDRVVDYFAHE